MFRPNELEVADLVRVLRRRSGIVLGFVLGFLALAFVLNVVTRPVFRTSARLQIQPTPSRSPVTGAAVENPNPASEHLSLLTTAERIMSRDVLELVARDMQARGIEMAERVPATTSSAPPPATASLAPPALAAPGDPQLAADVEWLGRNVSVRPVRDTRLVDIFAEHSDARAAAELANGVASSFMRSQSQSRRGADSERLTALRAQIAELRQSIQEAEQTLYNSRRTPLALATERSRQLVQSGNELTSSSIKARADLRVVEAQLERIRAFRRAATPDWSNPPIQTDALDQLYRDVQRAETAVIELRRQYRDQSVEVAAAEAQVNTLRDAMRRELQKATSDLEGQRDVLRARVDGFEGALAHNERTLEALSDSSRKYTTFESDLRTQRELYTLLMQRVQEQDVAQTVLPPGVELVQDAPVPLERVRPRKAMNLALGAALGLVFGAGTAFGLETMRRTIRTPQDVMHELRLPVLGMIPRRQ
jgi:uncharacterized protein involved in exopolysaccharide biosynthesis